MKVLLTALLGCACANALAEDVYKVRFDPELERVAVDACFDGAPPDRLYHHEDAARFARDFRAGERRLRLAPGAGFTRLHGLGTGPCLQWTVDLGRATARGEARVALRSGGALVADTGLWFWRGRGSRPARIEISVPEGMQLSVPWQELEAAGDRRAFRPDPTPATWSSRVAVGRLHSEILQVPGADLRLAIAGELTRAERDKLSRWLHAAATAVSTVTGSYPAETAQILVIPIGHRREAVPWAHVMRGSGPAAEFFVDETRPLSEFLEDWTAPHELSHLLLPFVSSRDRWLSEGLASWYQYLLLARSGAIAPEEAWQKLHEGFMRGRRDTSRKSLAEATREGWTHTMRVYWSGAALMMLADTRLRANSGGTQSLDTALAGLQSCCLPSHRRWRARELLAELDRVTGTATFMDLYDEHVHRSEFPSLEDTWRRLGIDASDRRLRFDDHGEWLAVRRAIMREVGTQAVLLTP